MPMTSGTATVKLRHLDAGTAHIEIVRDKALGADKVVRIPMSWDEFDETVADEALTSQGWRRVDDWAQRGEQMTCAVQER